MYWLTQIKKFKLKNSYVRYYYDPSHDESQYTYKKSKNNEIFFNNIKFEEYIDDKIKEEVKKYFTNKSNIQTILNNLNQTNNNKLFDKVPIDEKKI